MPQDDGYTDPKIAKSARPNEFSHRFQQTSPPWLQTPRPIKQVFDKFPLVTYEANDVPQRSAGSRSKHVLYVFTTADGAKKHKPSFNPGCLKWQAYLRFQGLDFITVPSNNHASPTGALPFLIPAASASPYSAPVPSTRLERWIAEGPAKTPKGAQGDIGGATEDGDARMGSPQKNYVRRAGDATDMRYGAYISLLDYRIRNAYLYQLYLCSLNFASVVRPLYIDTCTSNPLVRLALAHQLRSVAQTELLKDGRMINSDVLYRESDKAFGALSDLLGEDVYFFAEEKPGLFDAHVFAYTFILLDESLAWRERRMQEDLERRKNLVAHRERILQRYFPKE